MKRSTKAALLSGLVFPGLGQFLLKRYLRGTALVTVALVALYILITNIIEITIVISNKIIAGEVALDANTISVIITELHAGSEAQLINAATMAIIISWLLAIIDAYLIGREDIK